MTKAEQWVHDGLVSCLPPGVPLMGQIVEAQFTAKEKAVATLTMFDGQRGVVEVSKWRAGSAGAWCIGWQDTGNSPCHWTGSAWERIAPTQQTFFEALDQEAREKVTG